jgi:hypothetical protein
MASTNGVIFPESMADFLANPYDICFGSMPVTSTAPAACLVIEGKAITTNQHITTGPSKKTDPPTPSDLIAGIDRVEGMLSYTVKVCEHVKRPRTTPSTSSMPLWLAQRRSHSITLHEMQDPDRIWTLLSRSWKPRESPRRALPYPQELQTHRTLVSCPQEVSLTSYYGPSPPVEPRVVSRPPCVSGRPHNNLPELSGEEFETLDRQILVISADVPPQDGETEEQRQERENANAA